MAQILTNENPDFNISISPDKGMSNINIVPNIVPAPAPAPATPKDLSQVSMIVTELDALGRRTEYSVPLPTTSDYLKLSMTQKIWLLKSGRFSGLPVPLVCCAIVYAEQIRRRTGADIDEMQGDLYAVTNSYNQITFSLTNKAKIKIANATGRIKGIKINTVTTTDPIDLDGCVEPFDLECTVVLNVAGLDSPITKVQRLSEWFVKTNPNWKGRPRHMLELNTLAHACELVFPTETGEDEIPTLPSGAQSQISEALSQINQSGK